VIGRFLAPTALVFGALLAPGCIVLQSQHLELVEEVDHLKKRQATRDQELEATLRKAAVQMAKVEAQLERAAEVLGENQATMGVRVEDLEFDLGQIRGIAEDRLNALAALGQNVSEMRGELQERLDKLETATNAAAAIPEGKQALFRSAAAAESSHQNKQARKLYRIYLSRYPNDAKEAEVRFKIGLTLYQDSDDRSALGEFHWIISNRPQAKVIPDALYYSGLAWYRLHNCANAAAYFDAVLAEAKSSDRYKKAAVKQKATIKSDPKKICVEPPSKDAHPVRAAQDAERARKPSAGAVKPVSGSSSRI